jgi:hypothetical protein
MSDADAAKRLLWAERARRAAAPPSEDAAVARRRAVKLRDGDLLRILAWADWNACARFLAFSVAHTNKKCGMPMERYATQCDAIRGAKLVGIAALDLLLALRMDVGVRERMCRCLPGDDGTGETGSDTRSRFLNFVITSVDEYVNGALTADVAGASAADEYTGADVRFPTPDALTDAVARWLRLHVSTLRVLAPVAATGTGTGNAR